MKIINTLALSAIIALSMNAQDLRDAIAAPNVQIKEEAHNHAEVKPYYQGVILEMLQAGSYTYLLIDEKTPGYDPKDLKSFWIAVSATEAKVGDFVRFQKELVTENFKSKALNRTFDELMFASGLEYKVSKK